jgi:hypothetical protein
MVNNATDTRKGKPAARRGRKATNLFGGSRVAEWVSSMGSFSEWRAALCVCGHGFSYELRREGERLGTVAIFDDEPASEACGERVRECPTRGEQLGLHRLMARSGLEG